MPFEQTLPLERSDVLHDGCLAGKTEMLLDFAGARRQTFVPLFALNEIQNIFLSGCEHMNICDGAWAVANENRLKYSADTEPKQPFVHLLDQAGKIGKGIVKIDQGGDIRRGIGKPERIRSADLI